jgi:hypothetical protein
MSSLQSPKLQLKYCERCGALWLRPQGGQEVYCARCIRAIAELPPVRRRGAGAVAAPIAGSVAATTECHGGQL